MKSNGVIEITRDQAVARALLASKDAGYGYKLGSGGRNPAAARPYSSKGFVDCSGFVAWALGYDRWLGGDDWVNTDSILADSRGSNVGFLRPGTDEILPGDLLVYGSVYTNGERKPGHVGLITAVSKDFVRGSLGWWRNLTVAHATPRHRLRYGNVVALTDAVAWRKRGYLVRYLGFAEGGKERHETP